MTVYRIEIKGEFEAKNFESAQKKLAELEAVLKRKISAAEVHMKGEA